MSYRLINANNITFNSDGFITADNIEKMPCIYADLPNGMDGEHYVLEQQSTLDKIRAEIIELRSKQNVGVMECLDIIDKYKADRSDEE